MLIWFVRNVYMCMRRIRPKQFHWHQKWAILMNLCIGVKVSNTRRIEQIEHSLSNKKQIEQIGGERKERGRNWKIYIKKGKFQWKRYTIQMKLNVKLQNSYKREYMLYVIIVISAFFSYENRFSQHTKTTARKQSQTLIAIRNVNSIKWHCYCVELKRLEIKHTLGANITHCTVAFV